MPIYLAQRVTQAAKSTPAFLGRNVTDYTQAKPSVLNISCIPNSAQLAYDGYRRSFEAFLYATHKKTRVLCDATDYPIDVDTDFVPFIPIPTIRFVLKQGPNGEWISNFEKATFEKMAGEKVKIGQKNVYIFRKPTVKFVINTLPSLCESNCPHISNTSTAQGAMWFIIIQYLASLTLRVQTYDSKEQSTVEKTFFVPSLKRPYTDEDGRLFTTNAGDFKDLEGKTKKRKVLGDDGKITEEEYTLNLTPGSSKGWKMTMTGEEVLTAKPSPVPLSFNMGNSTSVPNKPGNFLPYFAGMFATDPQDFRSIVLQLFFRNIRRTKLTMAQSWKSFREEISGVMGTDEASALHHVIKSLLLAINGQARPFVIINDGIYQGTCLLGHNFSTFVANVQTHPMEAEVLHAELSRLLLTEAEAMTKLFVQLTLCKDSDGNLIVTDPYTDEDQLEVSKMLARIDESKSGDACAEITKLLASCYVTKAYQTFTIDNICEALTDLHHMMTLGTISYGKKGVPPFYIPLSGWKMMSSEYYHVFARFGPNSFSFMDPKGKVLLIPETFAGEKGEPVFQRVSKENRSRLPIYEKSISNVIVDWMKLVKMGAIMPNTTERAGSNRSYTYDGVSRERVVGLLVKFTEDQVIGGSGEVEVEKEGGFAGVEKKGVDFSEFVLTDIDF